MRKPCFHRWFWLGSLAIVLFGLFGGAIRAQSQMISPALAAKAIELPLGDWGPFSRAHDGPCYLVSRLPTQLFTFPIVIGQRRDELCLQTGTTAGGKAQTRPERMVLERRAMGLSLVLADRDDRVEIGPASALNRRAQILEGDADGLLWSARIPFAPAALAQTVAPQLDPDGKPIPPSAWGAGEATVECFPVYADTADGADGLLVRVTLVNRSTNPQTYFVDLLGGIDTLGSIEGLGAVFKPQGLSVYAAADPADGMIMQHTDCTTVLALVGNTTPYPLRAYRVSDAYFAPAGAVTRRDPAGVALPGGLLTAYTAGNALPNSPKKQDRRKDAERRRGENQKSSETPEKPAAETSVAWGLTRIDDISVAPGETVTLFLCVGVGKDADHAVDSGQTLLSLAEDIKADETMPLVKPREGAYTKALAAHHAARFNIGDDALERLMAQSLANVPFARMRRVGTPSRQATQGSPLGDYRPAAGGFIALGWAAYRPDWAAAQLNAWFLTNTDPDKPIKYPQAVPPTNLFALWDLFQRTHDSQMLSRFYPFARRRYQELLSAGRIKDDAWLFAWPSSTNERLLGDAAKPAANQEGAPRFYAPDYSAYVIRSAKILILMNLRTNQSPADVQGYLRDIAEATRALNTLWDAKRGLYVPQAVAAPPPSDPASPDSNPDTLAGLLPLIAGPAAQTPEQRMALLKNLTDPATFWSEAGLRTVSKASPAYRPNARGQGAISLGLNWLFWKALLDLGEADLAHKLAANVTHAYHAAQTASSICPEWLDGDTGMGGGATDYSGDACAVIPLYAAYHLPGSVTTGWEITILDSRYDPATDTLHVVFRSRDAANAGLLLCVLGKPQGRYILSGALSGQVTADANGVLTLTAPHDETTQMLDIAPAPAAGSSQ